MKPLLILILVFIPMILFGQEKLSDFIPEVKHYDISDLWTLNVLKVRNDTFIIERPEPLGYIGDKYQRFYIHFTSVIQNYENRLEYLVYGKSKVKTNICSFQGFIKILDSKIYDDIDFPNLKQGFINGSYEFYEDPDQKETGIFKGKFQTNFYIDTFGKVKYNDLRLSSDDFHNNQFEGKWISYKSMDSLKCNWGDFRIPDSRELDCGVAEFSPSKKYFSSDWLSFMLGHKMNNLDTKRTGNSQINKDWWLDK
jgi:hypothetical protein